MKVRLTLDRPGGIPVDLNITCDATTTVGDVADFLYAADPQRQAADNQTDFTIRLTGKNKTLARTQPVAESELQSGSVISLARSGDSYAQDAENVAAILRVIEGPDAGQEYSLQSGANMIGRMRDCQVRFSDPMVSRSHCRLNVVDTVEIIDLGSANGVLVNGEPADRRHLRTDDLVQIGDTTFSVRMAHLAGIEGRIEGTDVGFIRSPLLAKVYQGQKFEAPEPPEPVQLTRFPILSILAPIVMAGLMWAITRNILSLLFIALSPLMMIGSYLEQRMAAKGANRAALKLFRSDVADFVKELGQINQVERDMRKAEHPSTAECATAIVNMSPLLWTRRPDMPGFCEFRLGIGTMPTRNEIVLPSTRKGPRNLHAELGEAVAPFRTVDQVPVVVDPRHSGGIGIAGPRPIALAVARAVLLQVVALHSPAELVIAAVVSGRSVKDWDYLKWLPHNAPVNSPLEGEHLATTAGSAVKIISEIEQLIQQRASVKKSKDEDRPELPAVVLLVESDSPADFARLVAVAETGWKYSIHVIWIAPELAQLPASCRTYVDVADAQIGGVGYLCSGDLVSPVYLETLDQQSVEILARRLAPIIDLATRLDDSSDLPRTVSWLSLVGTELGSRPETIIERWRENRSITTGPHAPDPLPRKSGNLRAVLGQNGGGFHSLDLRVDGPHALVGGTTGAGKSELLQTWILGMAAANSPQRLTFLLVDYKGGSAFAQCNKLPHTVGLVTDLNRNGVRRALKSLSAELRYRERLLERYKAKDLVEMEKNHPGAAPPSLVIVVDEFAALVQEVPEFVDGVMNVAQRGRSLGLHLILATQRPAGVIKGNLRANTNLRIALRVADTDDSNDVIDSPMAAHFDQDLPGRAVSKTGPGRYVVFQTGYVGGHTGEVAPPVEPVVEELSLKQRIRWERPIVEDDPIAESPGPPDIARIVHSMRAAQLAAEIPDPRKPWLPELSEHYSLGSLPTQRRDDCLVFGIQDDADSQSQPTVAFYPDRQGSMVIFGASGSGKSTLLRTLAAAAGFTVRGGPCHVYALDFGARALSVLEEMPHVGSVIAGSDDERIQRVIKWLRQVIDERSRVFAVYNASTIREYRQLANKPEEPRIFLLVDGVSAFRAAYEATINSWVWEQFISIAAEGRPVGVHTIISADRVNAIPTALNAAMQSRTVLRMTDPNDYSFLGIPNDILTDKSSPGRAVVEDLEIQIAMLGKSADSQAQAAAVAAFSSAMVKAGISEAPPVQSLAERIMMAKLPTQIDGCPVIGERSSDLQPWTFQDKGGFVVTGPPGSGRTTTMMALRSALHRLDPSYVTILFAPRPSELTDLPWWRAVFSSDQVLTLINEMLTELQANNMPEKLALFVESVNEFINTELEEPLTNLIKIMISYNLFVVVEGEVLTLASGFSSLLNLIRSMRAGIALQPDSSDGTSVFKTDFPVRLKRADFPAGRGLLVWRSKTEIGQVMLPD